MGPLLKQAGFRFVGADEEEAFEFCQKLAEVVQRPILSEEYDFGGDALVSDAGASSAASPGSP